MWFQSKLKDVVNDLEQHIYRDYYNDLVDLNVTRDNYMKLIELCDYLCVTNVDILIDKIVDLYDTNIVHQFRDFYSLSQRLQRTNDYLKNGDISCLLHIILNWDKNKRACFKAYGHISYYDVSNFTYMGCLFLNTNIDEDLSQWDVSNLKSGSYIFSEKHKKNKILYNSIQSWKNYNLDIGI